MYYLILLQQLIASTTHIVSKDITASIAPELILLLRAGLASSVFAIWIYLKRKVQTKFEWSDLTIVALLGFLNIPANQYVFFLAIKNTTAPNVALAYALSPAFVLILSILFFGEKASFLKIIGIITAVAGTSIILLERGLDLSGYFWGNLLALMASFSWALYTILGKKLTLKYGAIKTTALTMIAGYLEFIPIFIILGVGLDVAELSPLNWFEVVYLGIGTSVLGYGIWFYALKHIDASKVSVFNNLQPVLTTIMAIIFFGQEITASFIIGGLLIISGVFTAQRG